MRKIEEAGFNIAMSKEMYLSREQAEDFYEEHKGEHYFESLINNMTRFVPFGAYNYIVHVLNMVISSVLEYFSMETSTS